MSDVKKVYFDTETGSVASNTYLDVYREEGYARFNIACGYDLVTEIAFTKQHIDAVVTAAGEVAFYDSERTLLASLSVPAEQEGRGCYQEIRCKVEGDTITLQFPLYSWYDNYPNCDGESDRWDARIIGYKAPIRFSTTTRTATVAQG